MLMLKRELDRLRISQSECARRAGVNQTSISRIVNRKEPAFPDRGRKIAEAIGWEGDPAELFEEVENDGLDAF